MATKSRAFVDTSALIAFADRSDKYHPLFRRLFSDPPPQLTSTLVIAEGHAWFLRRYDRTRALQFLDMIEEMRFLDIGTVDSNDRSAAVAILRRFSDQDLTLADAVGLHMMNRHRITQCWSTDFHMGLTGVSLVIHNY